MSCTQIKKNNKNLTKPENVRVVLRCRPLSGQEIENLYSSIVEIYPTLNLIEITCPNSYRKGIKKSYTYDAVFGWDTKQQILYDEVVKPLVESVLEGFNGCIFAYGQTGAGKTYTMEGNHDIPEKQGIIPRVFNQIWDYINNSENTQFLVSIKYLEIYMEEIRDLLKLKKEKPLDIREVEGRGVCITNARTINCKNVDGMHKAMKLGNKNRTVSSTNMNTHSSRSHAIFQIIIEMRDFISNKVIVGKLNLIDLAGSERQSKTGLVEDRLRESCKINMALSTLGKVISALSENSLHIPYRDSKLTRLLQDSLGGNSKTIMIANIGPANYNYEETLTTLRYANRAKNISNKPILNEDPDDAKLNAYLQEIEALKKLIAEREELQKRENFIIIGDSSDENESEEENKIDLEEKDNLVQSLEMEKLTNQELSKKLKKLEETLVEGGQHDIIAITEQQKNVEEMISKVTGKEKEEKEIQLKLDLEQEEHIGLQKAYNSIQQEIESKNSILKTFFNHWQQLKLKINEIRTEHSAEMQKLRKTEENILKSKELQTFVTSNFINSSTQRRILNNSSYEEKINAWEIKENKMSRSDLDEYRISKMQFNKRRNTDVLKLDLYKPVKSTISYLQPKLPPSYQKIVEACVKHEINNKIIEVTEPPPSFQPKQLAFEELEERYENSKQQIIKFPNTERDVQDYFAENTSTKRPSSRPTSRLLSSSYRK